MKVDHAPPKNCTARYFRFHVNRKTAEQTVQKSSITILWTQNNPNTQRWERKGRWGKNSTLTTLSHPGLLLGSASVFRWPIIKIERTVKPRNSKIENFARNFCTKHFTLTVPKATTDSALKIQQNLTQLFIVYFQYWNTERDAEVWKFDSQNCS